MLYQITRINKIIIKDGLDGELMGHVKLSPRIKFRWPDHVFHNYASQKNKMYCFQYKSMHHSYTTEPYKKK